MRIDDRLIHGQVITIWVRHKSVNHIVIVDDGVAADTFIQDVLKMAAPPGLQVDILSIDDGTKQLKGYPSAKTTMLILKNPLAAKRLYDGGVTFAELNVGGIGIAPGRKIVFRTIALSKEEYDALLALHQAGVKITFLAIPGEKSMPFSDLANAQSLTWS